MAISPENKARLLQATREAAAAFVEDTAYIRETLARADKIIAGEIRFTARIFAAVNTMMLDMLAAVARKDYEDHRLRQAQGIVKAKAAGAYRGGPEDTARNGGIAGMSWTAIQEATCCAAERQLPRSPSGPRRPVRDPLIPRRAAL